MVDTVPVYHVLDDGPVRAALMFRVGRGDEQAASGGITHVVEHLSLFRFGQQPYQYNGNVDPIRTLFVANGHEAEVSGFLRMVCENLVDLPLERVPDELHVLRNESSRRSVGPVDHHGWLRWGLHATGLGYLPEFGLWRLGPDEVRAWAADWFASANVALVWVGPHVPPLALPLPTRERRLPMTPVDLMSGPVWAVGSPDHAAISFRIARGAADASAQRILAKRLEQQLRYESGLSYDVSMHLQPLTAELATSTIWAGSAPGDATRVRDIMIRTAQSLASDGPTQEELAADLDALQRARANPLALAAEADRRAIQELLGAEEETFDEIEKDLAGVTPDDARTAFAAAIETAILTQPNGVGPPTDWLASYPWLLDGSPDAGRRFVHVREKAFGLRRRFPALVVANDSLALDVPGGRNAVIPFQEMAALIYGEQGSATALHDSGSQIVVNPAQWRDASQLQQLIASKVPAERVIVMTTDGRPATWANPAMPLVPMVVAIAGAVFLLYGATTFFEPTPPEPIIGGPLAMLTGLAFVTISALLPALAYGAENFRPWSWIPSAGILLSTALAVALGPLIHDVSGSLLLLLPAAFAAVHLWKLRVDRTGKA